mgnify:FL=1
MTDPLGYPPRTRRTRALPLVAGIALALAADAVALSGVPSLVTAWSGPSVTETMSPSTGTASPARTTALPTPTASKSKPTGAQTSGPVKVSDAVKRGIVLIDASLDSSATSAGTGMVLTASGEVLTNYHVVRSSTSITVTIAADGRKYAAKLVGRDATRDVALLQLQEAPTLKTVKTDADPVELDDPVVAAGNAGGQGYLTAFAGRIVGKDRSIRVRGASSSDPEENLVGLLETDAHAEPGDSGGPLFDAEYEVLGMTTAGTNSSSGGTAYAVPIATALDVVAKVRAGDETDGVVIGPKPSLGVLANDDESGSVKITKVLSGTAASRAGLKAGDFLTSIGGHAVPDLAALMATLDTLQPGQSVHLEWRTSAGLVKSADVVLDASKYN